MGGRVCESDKAWLSDRKSTLTPEFDSTGEHSCFTPIG